MRRTIQRVTFSLLIVQALFFAFLTKAFGAVVKDPNQTCIYCHYGPTAQSAVMVYELPSAFVVSDHQINASLLNIPSSTKAKNTTLKCLTCHTDHSGTNSIPGTALLRLDPFGDGGACSNVSEFCADCHDIPYRFDIFRNHPLNRLANNSTSFLSVSTCESCHSEGADDIGDYPHQGISYEFLGKGIDQSIVYSTNVDNNCLKCHVDQYPNPTKGVSYTF